MRWRGRAWVGASIGLGLLAACDAFDTGGDEVPATPDAGSTSGIASSSSSSGPSTSSSSGHPAPVDAGPSDSGASSSSGAVPCTGLSCPVNAFCDDFERTNPDDSDGGWTYAGSETKTNDFFHIAHDSGAATCDGVFYSLVESFGVDAGASRMMGRPITVPNHVVQIDLSFAAEGNIDLMTGTARAAFLGISTETKGKFIDHPFLALAMKDKQLLLLGSDGSSTVATSGQLVSQNSLMLIKLLFSTNGGLSTIQIDGVVVGAKALPSLGDGTSFTLFLGDAIGGAPVTSKTVAGRFDHLVVSTP